MTVLDDETEDVVVEEEVAEVGAMLSSTVAPKSPVGFSAVSSTAVVVEVVLVVEVVVEDDDDEEEEGTGTGPQRSSHMP